MTPGTDRAPERLLVVDDDSTNRDFLSRRLGLEGYDVSVASSGAEALGRISDGGFQLVLLDVMMPEMDGLEALRRIRLDHSVADLPVIMVTGKSDSEDVITALELGANDYVAKPIDIPVLLARVRTHLSMLRLKQERDELVRLKEDFLSIASHEIKTPLTTVLGFAVLAHDKLKPGVVAEEKYCAMLSRVVRGARSMARIVEDFLDLQALDDGRLILEKARIDLNEIARGVREIRSDTGVGRGIEIIEDLETGLRPIEADQGRITQVIENLVDNAAVFAPQDSVITLRTCGSTEGARLEVSDTGPDMQPSDLERVFTRYSPRKMQAEGGEKGCGWGMAISKQLIEVHGGQVGAFNNNLGGTTFWFSLPPAPASTNGG